MKIALIYVLCLLIPATSFALSVQADACVGQEQTTETETHHDHETMHIQDLGKDDQPGGSGSCECGCFCAAFCMAGSGGIAIPSTAIKVRLLTDRFDLPEVATSLCSAHQTPLLRPPICS